MSEGLNPFACLLEHNLLFTNTRHPVPVYR